MPSDPAAAATPAGELPIFVIQEHHATALHWDFRLERDGVLVSWAVPRGVPHSYKRNNLAIMTEDHPMDYATFEGSIPAGEYGGGSVTIWDDGRYELEKWRDDEVIATLEGRPGGPLGRVRLALIRTDGEGEKSTWLLHRMKTDVDGHVQPDGIPVEPSVQADEPRGARRDAVARVRDLAARSTGMPRRPQRAAPRTLPPRRRRGPSGRRATALAAERRRTAADAVDERDTGARRRSPRASGATRRGRRRSGTASARSACGTAARLRLVARSGNDITAKYPEVTEIDAGLGDEPAIVDGEIVAIDERGRPSFPLLQTRMNLQRPGDIAREAKRTPVQYYLFDVLGAHGLDVTARPLRERRQILEELASARGRARSWCPRSSTTSTARSRRASSSTSRASWSRTRRRPIVAASAASRGSRSSSPARRRSCSPASVPARAVAPRRSGRCCSASPVPTVCSTRAGSAPASATRPCAR